MIKKHIHLLRAAVSLLPYRYPYCSVCFVLIWCLVHIAVICVCVCVAVHVWTLNTCVKPRLSKEETCSLARSNAIRTKKKRLPNASTHIDTTMPYSLCSLTANKKTKTIFIISSKSFSIDLKQKTSFLTMTTSTIWQVSATYSPPISSKV